ncbi:cob(I)yrinic acid a,c-diamide adenosyltransferase [Enterococcus faecalis]|uniref:cob(I)yrinic acid a,c-diamide adenosyltransferase n=1 Tax=Enterococcus faecalis TaxID=1351 RepID=UPI000451A7A7|nr:cob(I)yrinic acid a,c-diamide adenosyltransferase [Enterococcus faecalis]EGO2736160.1 cob(I)yrinic acid a,c-diamide adenosyltransferase [Enterococcus faecalis]EGO7584601.1 cob(I)yrinic acid a,c-diamide adenosyltransferase [Enterococcus faecalis]EGO7773648.1 cob(I)yrinic acid a,c-diamide adenosyltransferase [Enterococcus faecalis]EGO8087946.1 cob(I)yrinic acid a,c-diamide adenosyltransferase [Enterococcus faecalis]EGO8233806.1 cob(I)yrinic acid a,c-diamide adenosyltransferase [Enterococcus f
MKIYTKTGDKGMTKLVGSSTVAKDSDRVESYGTIDELNSWVGYIISQLPQENQEIKEELEALQHLLFDAGTDLSTPIEAQRPFKLQKGSVHWLEQRIDFYTAQSPDIDRFILPGGTPAASMVHVARTIARRAERIIVRLNWTAKINEEVLIFTNRLSDYFYALARYLNVQAQRPDVFYERSEKVFHKIKEDGL